MLTCFLFYLIVGTVSPRNSFVEDGGNHSWWKSLVAEITQWRKSLVAEITQWRKSLSGGSHSVEEITQWRKSLKDIYRSMLNLHVILVGLADHARLVNTYIPSLDWYYNIDVFVCTCTSHRLEEKWVTTFFCDVLHVILLYWPYSVRTLPVPTGR